MRRLSILLLALILAGCAEPTGAPSGDAAPSGSPLSQVPPPTLGSPTAPPKSPKSPTDPRPGNVVAGTVTADGLGPCYAVRTDDGTDYALFGTGGWTVHKGDVVRATVTTMPPGRSCPGGRPAAIVTLEIL